MAMPWCAVCCTQHPSERRCPGSLQATGPETTGWQICTETPRGPQGYGVLLAQAGKLWRSRIVTFPNVIWTVPGGGGSLKFCAREQRVAERKAIDFIRQHCVEHGYVMRDELAPLGEAPAAVLSRKPRASDTEAGRRFRRQLPIHFGRNRPTVRATTDNLSQTGLFVTTETPLWDGELVGLMLEMEHLKVPLRASVMWNRPAPMAGLPPGMGLKLLNPPHAYIRYLQALAA